MNRFASVSPSLCPPPANALTRRTPCFAVASALLWGFIGAFVCFPSAWAQNTPGLRPFPPGFLRGALVVGQHPDIRLDGKPERLSPGARIHGADNLIVLSSALRGQTLVVNFVRETHGLVHEVWILTPAEAATPAP